MSDELTKINTPVATFGMKIPNKNGNIYDFTMVRGASKSIDTGEFLDRLSNSDISNHINNTKNKPLDILNIVDSIAKSVK